MAATFNVSNTLGNGMVLQRFAFDPSGGSPPQQAVVWGFGTPGTQVKTTVSGKATHNTTVGADGVWRQALLPMPASIVPTDITFTDGAATNLALRDVLFGDVYICSGQSNMQYTPHSMSGMNNLTAELAAAVLHCPLATIYYTCPLEQSTPTQVRHEQ